MTIQKIILDDGYCIVRADNAIHFLRQVLRTISVDELKTYANTPTN